MTSLSVKYRPTEFEDVCSQSSVIKILKQQLATSQFVNTYIFSGPSGTGKTTLARILTSKINKSQGNPIEIDAASNNGVDNVRLIIDTADQRALDAEYKVYIIDECHMLTTQAWNALLKLVEEPPKYTIFIFCTTELQKVPFTIQNRCQMYHLSRIPDKNILDRLVFISNKENIKTTSEALSQITKLSQGSMRQAIAYLDKCKDYADIVDLNCVIEALGDYSYDLFFDLTNYIIDKKADSIIKLVESQFNKGLDLKIFIEQYIDFLLDVAKYCIFKSFDIIKIPTSYQTKLDYITNLGGAETGYYNYLVNYCLNIKTSIKGDLNILNTIEIMLLNLVYKSN